MRYRSIHKLNRNNKNKYHKSKEVGRESKEMLGQSRVLSFRTAYNMIRGFWESQIALTWHRRIHCNIMIMLLYVTPVF